MLIKKSIVSILEFMNNLEHDKKNILSFYC